MSKMIVEDELDGQCNHMLLCDEVDSIAEGNIDIGMQASREANAALKRAFDVKLSAESRVQEISLARKAAHIAQFFFNHNEAALDKPREAAEKLYWSSADLASYLLEPTKYELDELDEDDLDVASEAIEMMFQMGDSLYPPSSSPPKVAGAIGVLANFASAVSVEALVAGCTSADYSRCTAQLAIAAKAAPIAQRLFVALKAINNARLDLA